MKKLIFVYLGLIAAFILLAFLGFGNNLPSFLQFGRNAQTEINGQILQLIVARSDEERMRGLSGKETLPENQGMLFIFKEKGEYPFWMKGVRFPIDIIFINDDTVVYIVENAQPPENEDVNPERFTPPEPVNYVLEINGGKVQELNIEVGTKITFSGL